MTKSKTNIYTLVLLSGLLISCKTIAPGRMKIYDQIVGQIMKEPVPMLELGESSVVKSRKVGIWYEIFKTERDSAKGTILLIQGIGETAIGWDDFTYNPFVKSGYNVIRFDNREVGRSTWTQNLDYDLSDMANDMLAIMNDLDLKSAHIIGQSMGGMIAQEFALNYPEKVESLSLIYTTGNTFDKNLPLPCKDFEKKLKSAYFTYSGEEIESQIKLELAIKDALNVALLEQDELLTAARRMRFEIEQRKGVNEKAFDKQEKAIKISGARWNKLKELKMPTIVIHGEEDPICQSAHGKKLASYIPHAKTVWAIEQGHYITKDFSEIIVKEILNLIE